MTSHRRLLYVQGTEHWRKVLLQQVQGLAAARSSSGTSEDSAEELQAALAALQEITKDQKRLGARTEPASGSHLPSPQHESRLRPPRIDSPRSTVPPARADGDSALSAPAPFRGESPRARSSPPRSGGDVAASSSAPTCDETPLDGIASPRSRVDFAFSAAALPRGEIPRAGPPRSDVAAVATAAHFLGEVHQDRGVPSRSDGGVASAAFPSMPSAAPSILGPASGGPPLNAHDSSSATYAPFVDTALYYTGIRPAPPAAQPVNGLGLLGAPPSQQGLYPLQSPALQQAEPWSQAALPAQFSGQGLNPATFRGGIVDPGAARGLHAVLGGSTALPDLDMPEQARAYALQPRPPDPDARPSSPASSEPRRESSGFGIDARSGWRGRERTSSRSRSPNDDERSQSLNRRRQSNERSSSPLEARPPSDAKLTIRDLEEFRIRPRVTGHVILVKPGFLVARVDAEYVRRYASLWTQATRHPGEDLWAHVSEWPPRWHPSEGDRIEAIVVPSARKPGVLQGEKIRAL